MLSVARVLTSREVAWENALTSRMNVGYYERRITCWKRWDVGIHLVCAAAASASIMTFARQHSILGVEVASILVLTSALLTVGGMTLRVPDKVRELGVLLSEYRGHVHRFERLYQFGGTDDELKAALDLFGETELREAKDHPSPNEAELEKSRKEVLTSIGAS
jgi:hypothetical protein